MVLKKTVRAGTYHDTLNKQFGRLLTGASKPNVTNRQVAWSNLPRREPETATEFFVRKWEGKPEPSETIDPPKFNQVPEEQNRVKVDLVGGGGVVASSVLENAPVVVEEKAKPVAPKVRPEPVVVVTGAPKENFRELRALLKEANTQALMKKLKGTTAEVHFGAIDPEQNFFLRLGHDGFHMYKRTTVSVFDSRTAGDRYIFESSPLRWLFKNYSPALKYLDVPSLRRTVARENLESERLMPKLPEHWTSTVALFWAKHGGAPAVVDPISAMWTVPALDHKAYPDHQP